MSGAAQTRQRLTKVAGMLLSDSAAEAQTALTLLRRTTQDAGITAGAFKEGFAAIFDSGDKLSLTQEELADLVLRKVGESRSSEPDDDVYRRLKQQRDAAVHNTRLTLGAFAFVLADAWMNQNDGSNYLWLGTIVAIWLVFLRYR